MLNLWNKSNDNVSIFSLPTFTVPNINDSQLDGFNDSEIGIYKSTDWFVEISPNALAITQYFAVRKNIGLPNEYLELVHADIILNYKNYNFSKNPGSIDSYHMPSVILHELGHLIGLSHQNDYSIPSVMSPFMSIVQEYSKLSLNDTQRVNYKYSTSALKNNLNNSNGPILGALKSSDYGDKKKYVRGVIELKSNGKCNHYTLKD